MNTLLMYIFILQTFMTNCHKLLLFCLFPDVLGYENGSIGAATITVIIVHAIIGSYIWVAINEEEKPRPFKQD